jgi:three-Cys-motif partner protein
VAVEDEFFDEQSEASEVKARIVEKYFDVWAKIVLPTAKAKGENIAYIDLYCGPGRYGDNQRSTPLLVLEKALASPGLCRSLITIFNDENEAYTEKLLLEIKALSGIDRLAHPPSVICSKVGPETEKYFNETSTVAALTFVDPFGYAGLTRELIRGVTKNWGCDCVFFFNYKRINQALVNPVFKDHMRALFGPVQADELYSELNEISGRGGARIPQRREELIMDTLARTIAEVSGPYVLPFRFRKGSRTSHNLVFVTKHPKGYQVMKEIMAKEGRAYEGGIPSFAYTDADTPYLRGFAFEFQTLKTDLCTKFAGKNVTMGQVFEQHNIGTPYIERNYKDALNELEAEGRIRALPAAADRPRRNGKPTFANGVMVVFP